jgi:hypothetical protein
VRNLKYLIKEEAKTNRNHGTDIPEQQNFAVKLYLELQAEDLTRRNRPMAHDLRQRNSGFMLD